MCKRDLNFKALTLSSGLPVVGMLKSPTEKRE